MTLADAVADTESVRTRSRDISARFTKLEQVKTFDRDFDRRFIVRAPDRSRAAALLTPELRERLLAEPRSWLEAIHPDGRVNAFSAARLRVSGSNRAGKEVGEGRQSR